MDDGSKLIEIAFSGDAGGGSMKHSFSLLNHKDNKLIQHMWCYYEAGDTEQNSIKVYSEFSEIMEEMNDAKIVVDGELLTIRQYGIYDLKEQDTILGKQGSTSTQPCAKCKVLRTHLLGKNHGGKPCVKES